LRPQPELAAPTTVARAVHAAGAGVELGGARAGAVAPTTVRAGRAHRSLPKTGQELCQPESGLGQLAAPATVAGAVRTAGACRARCRGRMARGAGRGGAGLEAWDLEALNNSLDTVHVMGKMMIIKGRSGML
jgi:hypothetical protein